MNNPFTAHPNETLNPEGYWVHFHRSFNNGWILIWAGTTSIIHAFFPWWWKFYTAETVVRLWADLHNTGRHDALLEKWHPQNHISKPRVPQCEPAELEAHPSHTWEPGLKGPRDE
jgi:hypothetical protein